jgi:formate hydrogenlyase subunit 6/NADH:ubiquinone oxidoreductase subunit I
MLDFKYQIDQEKCIGCEKCAEVCPTETIDFDVAKKKAYVLNIDQCLVCHQCLEVCRVRAIQMSGGLWQEDIRIPKGQKTGKALKGGYWR